MKHKRSKILQALVTDSRNKMKEQVIVSKKIYNRNKLNPIKDE
jgi:hypothetical protein